MVTILQNKLSFVVSVISPLFSSFSFSCQLLTRLIQKIICRVDILIEPATDVSVMKTQLMELKKLYTVLKLDRV